MAGSSKFNLSAQLNVQAQVRQAEKAIQGLASKPLVINVQTSTQGLKALSTELAKVRRQTKEVKDGFEDFADKAALAGKRFAAFTVATTGVFALASAFKSGIKEASDFQVELLKIKQVTRESSNNVKGLSKEVFDVSRKLGVSSKEILSVGLTLAQAGRSIQEVKDSLSSLAKTRLAATFGDINDTVNALIAAQEQFRISSKDTEQVLGSINVLSAKYAVEAQDLTVAIQKAGGAFAALGKSTDAPRDSLNELLSLFTAVRSTSRESADTIATGLRTVFARIRRPKTVETLASFGINLKDADGLLKKPLDAIKEISRATQGLDRRDIRFSQIVEEIGGIRQQAKVIPLLDQIEKAERALITATQGANSLTRDAEIAQQSLANQLAKTREEFLKLINDGFNSKEFQNFAKVILQITNGFIEMGKAIGPILPAIGALGAAKFFRFGGGANQIEQSIKNQFVTKKKFAKGGIVPGTGNTDSVPAMLTPGELVVPKNRVKKFARGGYVYPNLLDRNKPELDSRYEEILEKAHREGYVNNLEIREYNTLKRQIKSGKEIFDIAQKRRLIKSTPAYGITYEKGLQGVYSYDKDKISINPNFKEQYRTNRHEISHALYRRLAPEAGQFDFTEPKLSTSGKKTKALNENLTKFTRRILKKLPAEFLSKHLEYLKYISSKDEPLAYSTMQISDPKKFVDAFQGKIPNKVHRRNLRNSLAEIIGRKGGPIFQQRPPLKYASGGNVPGSGRGDKVPAMLEPGEFVIPRDSAKKFPRGYLESIRNGKKPQGYANGGYVFQPNITIKSPKQAEAIAKQIFTALGLPIENFVKDIQRFSKKEEKERKNRLGKIEYGPGGSPSTIKIQPGKATEGVLVHEIGHAIYSGLDSAGKKAFSAIAHNFDPVVSKVETTDKLVQGLQEERQSLRGRKNSGQELSSKERSRLKYLENRGEITARGFAQNPLAVIAKSQIGVNPNGQFGPFLIGGSGNKVPPSPPKIPPSGPSPNNQPGRFSNMGQNILAQITGTYRAFKNTTGPKLKDIGQTIKENPLQSYAALAVINSFADKLGETNKEFATVTKAATGAATQFLFLSTILGTFGKTAKETQKLQEDDARYQKNQNQKRSAAAAKLDAINTKREANSVNARLKRIDEARASRERDLSANAKTIKANTLTIDDQKNLKTLKSLEKEKQALLNPINQKDIYQKLAQVRRQNKGNRSDEEDTLVEQLNLAKATATTKPLDVHKRIQEIDRGIKDINTQNPDLLNKQTNLAAAKDRRAQLSRQIAKLRSSGSRDQRQLNELIKRYNEEKKLEDELRKGLLKQEELAEVRTNSKLQNNKAVKGRRTKADLERLAKIEGRFTKGIAGATFAGTIASDLSEQALRKNPQSRGAQAGSVIGGGLSGAAEGAAAGLVFGPWGAAVGAAAGAAYGFYTSVNRINESLRDIKLDESMRNFNRILENVRDNKLGASGGLVGIRKVINEQQDEFIKSRGDVGTRDRAENLAGGLHGFLRDLAKSSQDFKEFQTNSKGLTEFVSRFTGKTMKDLDKEFRDLVKSGNDLNKVQKELSAAQIREDTRAIATAGLLNIFGDSAESLKEFEDVLSGGVSDLSGVFNRLGQIKDGGLLGRVNAQADSILGGFGQSGKDFLNEANLVNEIGNKLPTILSEVFKKGLLEVQGGEHINEIEDRLKEVTGNKQESSFIRDAVIGALGDRIKSGDINKEIAGGNLKAVVDDTLEHVRKGIGEVLEQSIKLRTQELKLIESTLGKVTELRDKQSEFALSIIDIAEKRATGNAPNNRLSLGARQAFDTQRLAEISGQRDNSVGGLAGTLGASRTRLDAINKQLQNAKVEDSLKLENQKRQEIETINRTEKALRFLGDAASRVAHIEDDIARAKALREAKSGLLEDFAFAEPDQQREMAKNFFALQRVRQTGDIRSIPPNFRGAVKGLLDRDPSDEGKEFKNRVVEKFFGRDIPELRKSKEEANLEGQRNKILDEATAANMKLREDAIRQEKDLTSAINTQFPQFLDGLQKLFLDNREADLKLKVGQENQKLGGLVKQEDKALRLQRALGGTKFAGLTNQDTAELRGLLPLVKDTKDSQNKINKLQKLDKFGISNLNEDFQPTKNVKDNVDKLFRPLQEAFGPEEANKIFAKIEERFGVLSTGPFGGQFKEVDQGLLSQQITQIVEDARKAQLTKEQENLKTKQGELGKAGLQGKDLEGLQRNFTVVSKLFEELGQFKEAGSLAGLQGEFDKLSGSVGLLNTQLAQIATQRATTEAVKSLRGKVGGGLFGIPGLGLASGGIVPGSGNGDTVPAMLTPGEFVIRKDAAAALGSDTLHRLNNTQFFAGGGKVLSPIEQFAKSQGEDFRKVSGFRRNKIRERFQAEANVARRTLAKGQEYNPGYLDVDTQKTILYYLGGLERSNKITEATDRNNTYRRDLVRKRQYDARSGRTQPGQSLPSSFIPFERRELGRNGSSPAQRRAEDRAEAAARENRKYERRTSGHLTVPNFNKPKNYDLAFGSGKFGSGTSPNFNLPRSEPGFSSSARLKERGIRDAMSGPTYSGFRTGVLTKGEGAKFPELNFKDKRPIHRAKGGPVGTSNISSGGGKGLECSLSSESINRFEKALNTFSQPIDKFVSAIEKFPKTITLEGRYDLNIYHNGAAVFEKIQDSFKEMVIEEVKRGVNRLIDEKMPQVGRLT